MSSKAADSSTPVTFQIIGDAFVDLFCFLDGDWPEHGGDAHLHQPVKSYAGGSSVNTTTHLKSLIKNSMVEQNRELPYDVSPNVILHTVLNPNDEYGQLLLKHADKHDFPIVNCRKLDDESSTGHCIAIVSRGERSFMTHQGCIGPFNGDDLNTDKIIETQSHLHVHVSGLYNMSGFWNGNLENLIKRISNERKERFPHTTTTFSLVTQFDATGKWDGGIRELIPMLDFTILNDLEAKNIVERGPSGEVKGESEDEISAWASYFNSICAKSTIIVTRGKLGAVALKGGKMIAKQASVVVEPVDPTGAGDAFAAGFLHGIWSWQRQSSTYDASEGAWPVKAIEEGLRWGCAMGRYAVLIRGASVPVSSDDIQKINK